MSKKFTKTKEHLDNLLSDVKKSPETVALAKFAIQRKKAEQSFGQVKKKTAKDSDASLDIERKSAEERRAVAARLNNQDLQDEAIGRPLPQGFNKDISFHTNKIFEQTYLQPFAVSSKTQKPIDSKQIREQKAVQRKTHGAMHASRVVLWTRLFINLYKELGDPEALKLTSDDILLISIAAAFHDSARESDGVDEWDEQSADRCYKYFKEMGVDEVRARYFSDAARHKDNTDSKGNKNIAQKAIHDADCLDVIRLCYQFQIKYLDIYQQILKDKKEPELSEWKTRLENLALAVREIISDQNDLYHKDHEKVARIAYDYSEESIIKDGDPIPPTFDLTAKKRFEHAENCYSEIRKNILDKKLEKDQSPKIVSGLKLIQDNLDPSKKYDRSYNQDFEEEKFITSDAKDLEINEIINEGIKRAAELKKLKESKLEKLKTSTDEEEKKKIQKELSELRLYDEKEAKIINDNSTVAVLRQKGTLAASSLSPAEKKIMEIFINLDWILHHTTDSQTLHKILSTEQLELMDPVERKKHGLTGKVNAPGFGGVGRNVFFGLCPRSAYSPPLFTQNNSAVTIIFSVSEILKHNPRALYAMWGSGHFNHYRQDSDQIKNTGEATIIGDTQYSWTHKRGVTQKHFIKELEFKKLSTGKIYKQEIGLGEEIITGSEFFVTLGLRLIERMRFLNKEGNNPAINRLLESAEQLNKETNPELEEDLAQAISDIFGELFRVDDFEVKVPTKIPLNQEGTEMVFVDKIDPLLIKEKKEKHLDTKTEEGKEHKVDIKSAEDKELKFDKIKAWSLKELNEKINSAARKGDIKEMEQLQKQEKNFRLDGSHYTLSGDNYPLAEAIKHGQVEMVKWLIKQGANKKIFINDSKAENLKKDIVGASIISVNSNINLEKLEILMEVNLIKDKYPEIPLILINAGAKGVDDPLFLFFKAVQLGRNGLVMQFIDIRHNVNQRDGKGCTPLICATINNNIDLVKMLLDKKAEPDLVDQDGDSALLKAVCLERTEIIKLLLEKKARIDLPNKSGDSPLLNAIYHGRIEIVKLMFEKNSNINLPDQDGDSALLKAVRFGRIEIVKLLLDNKARIDLPDKDGNSPLLKAIDFGHTEIVQLLLEKNAKVDLPDKDGNSPLLNAIRFGRTEIVKLLLEKNAKVDLSSQDGDSPLLKAVHFGHTEIVKLLLEKNARVDLVNKNRNSALFKAVNRFNSINNDEVKEPLKQIIKLLITKDTTTNFVNDKKYYLECVSTIEYLNIPQMEKRGLLKDLTDQKNNHKNIDDILKKGDSKQIQELIKNIQTKNLSAKFTGSNGKTVLHKYLKCEGKTDDFTIKLLCDFPLNQKDKKGNNVLNVALKKKNYSAAKIIVKECIKQGLSSEDMIKNTIFRKKSNKEIRELFRSQEEEIQIQQEEIITPEDFTTNHYQYEEERKRFSVHPKNISPLQKLDGKTKSPT